MTAKLYVEPLFNNSKIVKKQTDHAACYDIHAQLMIPTHKNTPENLVPVTVKTISSLNTTYYSPVNDKGILIISPGERVMVPTGLRMCCDPGYKIQAVSRSGMSHKKGLILTNGVGTIDADYRDQVFILLANITDTAVTITHGDRIAQLEVIKLEPTNIIVGKLPSTESSRTGGFGSTGS